MAPKNEAQSDIQLFNYLNKKGFTNKWVVRKTSNKHIKEFLDGASKKANGNKGYPDFIYINEARKLLILIENKDSIQNHVSKTLDKPILYAVDGIQHYLGFFVNSALDNVSSTTRKYITGWSIIGVAVSGAIDDDYNHLISTFSVRNDEIVDNQISEIYGEDEYTALTPKPEILCV